MKRLWALVAALCVLAVYPIFAQNKTSLNVICNQVGAQVYINGRLAGTTTPNFSFLVPQGKVQVRVQKNGFKTFETIATVGNQPLTLNVVLESLSAPPPVVIQPPVVLNHSLTVNANVQGAEVLINGNPAGKIPFSAQVPPGSYSVLVRAPGYADKTENVLVKGPVQLNIILQGLNAMLSVNANVQGAEVLINGNPAGKTPFNAQVPPGSYSVLVRAPGFMDKTENVVVKGPVQLNVILQGINFPLIVNANVQGAEVLINGNPAGKAPLNAQVPPGSYSITVRAPGFIDKTENLLVNGPAQLNLVLQPLNFQLTVDAVNFKGAFVLINGNQAGQTPYIGLLPPGSYNLTIRAPGFIDSPVVVNLNSAQNVTVQLQPVPASWQLSIPEALVNKDLKGGHWNEIQVYVDGLLQKATSGQANPGKHTFRLVSGGLAYELSLDFQAGKTYTIEPMMGFNVK
jgi:hypothetical protein